ncbi:MAG: hypothetical protein ACFFCS_26535 [Candidatus Hodarchaeota archaeon]
MDNVKKCTIKEDTKFTFSYIYRSNWGAFALFVLMNALFFSLVPLVSDFNEITPNGWFTLILFYELILVGGLTIADHGGTIDRAKNRVTFKFYIFRHIPIFYLRVKLSSAGSANRGGLRGGVFLKLKSGWYFPFFIARGSSSTGYILSCARKLIKLGPVVPDSQEYLEYIELKEQQKKQQLGENIGNNSKGIIELPKLDGDVQIIFKEDHVTCKDHRINPGKGSQPRIKIKWRKRKERDKIEQDMASGSFLMTRKWLIFKHENPALQWAFTLDRLYRVDIETVTTFKFILFDGRTREIKVKKHARLRDALKEYIA